MLKFRLESLDRIDRNRQPIPLRWVERDRLDIQLTQQDSIGLQSDKRRSWQVARWTVPP
jgi:hypothetical protein